MKIFKSIWTKRVKEKKFLSNSFASSVKEVIQEIDNIKSEISDDQFYEIISKREINQFEADEIYIFLPIAFAQLWAKEVKWHDEYNEVLPNKKQISKRFDETLSFQIILEIVTEYFKNNPSQNTVIQIGGRSAEINAINQLLLEGGKVEDVKVTKTTIIR